MNLDFNQPIVNGKTRTKLISDYDTRNLQSFAAILIILSGIILTIILHIYGNDKISVLPILIGFGIGWLLNYLSLRCPICDELKSQNYYEFFIFRIQRSGHGCLNCRLTNRQIDKVFDLLIQNKFINEKTIEQIRNM